MGGSNPVYQSRAPEARGERAISSDIELVREVNLDGSLLGVFYAHEVYQSGDVHTVLFTRRAAAAFGGGAKGTMDDYDLSETASMSVDQARKFLKAIDNFSAMEPKSMASTKMYNFELYSGTLDLKEGSEKYRPFQDVTFVVVCSVTTTKKVFKTVFPTTMYDFYGRRSISYATFELKPEQVKNLRDAVAAALEKAPLPTAAPADKSGT
jgi:hypothetical protein